MRACLREQKSYGLRFSWFPMHLVCRVVEFSLYSQRAVTVSTITSLVFSVLPIWRCGAGLSCYLGSIIYALPQMIFQAGLPPSHCIYVSVRYALPNMLCSSRSYGSSTTCSVVEHSLYCNSTLLLASYLCSTGVWEPCCCYRILCGASLLSTRYPLQVALSMRTVFRVSHAEIFCLLLASQQLL